MVTRRNTDDWVSVAEAANRLGMSREAVYTAIEEGRLKGRLVKVVRKVWRIDPSSLDAFKVSIYHQRLARRSHREE